jgi:hypothetical protein
MRGISGMSNDFLTNLSSRTIQQDGGMDFVVGGLRPRLASRFETAVLPEGQGFEENTQIETPGIPDAHLAPRSKSALADEYRTEVQVNRPDRGEQTLGRTLNSQLQSMEVPRSIPGAIENQTAPTRPESIAHDHQATLHVPALRTIVKLVPFQNLVREEKNDFQPVPLLAGPILPTHAEIIRGGEPQVNNNVLQGSQPSIVSSEKESNLPSDRDFANDPMDEPKVVPQRIEITHRESQYLISRIQKQLVPAIARQEKGSQLSTSETEPGPTINVTIGRIEVKATASAPEPKRSASTTRSMSLDEYLQRRQGGQR